MFSKFALSILFTTNTIHKVTAGNKRGDPCVYACDVLPFAGDLHCHTLSWNGDYRRDRFGNKLLEEKRCVLHGKLDPESKKYREGKKCISDHECDYGTRHKYADEIPQEDQYMLCVIDKDAAENSADIDEKAIRATLMDNQGTCVKTPRTTRNLPVHSRNETVNRGQRGQSCREQPQYTWNKSPCDTGLKCMHQPKVTLNGCYAPASTAKGHHCFDHVECKGALQCQTFLVPKYIKMASGGIKQRPKDAPGYSKELCAPEGSTSVLTSVIYPGEWVQYPKKEFIPEHTMKVRVYKDTGDSPIIDDTVKVTAVDDSATIQPDSADRTVAPHHAPYGAVAEDGTVTPVSPIEYSDTDVQSMHTSVASKDSKENAPFR